MEDFNIFISNISSSIGAHLDNVLGALLVFILGLFIASLVRKIIAKMLRNTQLDERINKRMNTHFDFETVLSKLAYYLVLLFVVLIVLDLLGVNRVLNPLESMLAKFSKSIPNMVIATLVGFAGYILGRIASEAVGLVANSIESFSERIGWNGRISITSIVKQLVFLLVFVPILIVAFDYLHMYAITQPATAMFAMLLSAIPKILYAVAILAVFYFVGKYVIQIVVDLLHNLGVDQLTDRMEIDQVIGQNSLSRIIGNVLFFFLMFAAVISASDILELNDLTVILNDLLDISGKIVFGLIILLFGNFISIYASRMVANENSTTIRNVARYAILIIFMAMSLHTMGIAPSIVNLAFGLTLGAIAVAAALAFGLGGREAAGKHLDYLLTKWRNNQRNS